MDGRHKYIIGLVALQINSTDAEVEDNVLDGNQVFNLFIIFLELHYYCSGHSWTTLMTSLLLMAGVASCSTTRRHRPQSLVSASPYFFYNT